MNRFGVPGEIIADRGELHGEQVQKLAEKDGLVLKFTSPYYPQTNGMVERGHGPLVECLRKLAVGKEKAWPTFLSGALWADRVSWKRTTGETPFRLVYGYDCVLPMDIDHKSWAGLDWKNVKTTAELLETRARQLQSSLWLREIAGVRLDESRRKNKEIFDEGHRIREQTLEVGSLVLMRDSTLGKKDSKLRFRWRGPYRIKAIYHEGVYQLEELDGTFFRRSVSGNHLVPFYVEEKRKSRSRPESRAGGG